LKDHVCVETDTVNNDRYAARISDDRENRSVLTGDRCWSVVRWIRPHLPSDSAASVHNAHHHHHHHHHLHNLHQGVFNY